MLDTLELQPKTTIRPITKQARKRAIGQPCSRCGHPITPDAVFDDPPDGTQTRISHRSCAERINARVDEINREAAMKRLADAGIEIARPRILHP